MADVCVITGGGSGMGLAAAKFMPKEKIILIAGRTQSKLAKAADDLKSLGYHAYFRTCDTSKRESVRALAEYAASLGTVRNVINAAGLSPAMAKPEQLIRVNALGAVYVNQEFAKVMGSNSVIVDISSNSAYALPKIIIPKNAYKLADTNEKEFLSRMIKRSSLPRGDYEKSGLAYALSKNFAVWYAQKSAFELGKKGIRVLSTIKKGAESAKLAMKQDVVNVSGNKEMKTQNVEISENTKQNAINKPLKQALLAKNRTSEKQV